MKNYTDQEFSDLVTQYMTDEEKYEIECLDVKEAIEKFISVFGESRWEEISHA